MNDRLPSLADISTSCEDEGMSSDAESVSVGMTTQSNADSNVSSSVAEEIGKEETKMVLGSRFIMIVMLLVAAGTCAVGTYVFSVDSEFDIFETHVSQSVLLFPCYMYDVL